MKYLILLPTTMYSSPRLDANGVATTPEGEPRLAC
jgi:hypothetical protein